MPAVQLAELLAELADVEPDLSRPPGPVRVPLLDIDLAVLEADEDLGRRVRVEGRLKTDLELTGIEVVALHARRGAVGAHVARDADLGVELRLVALSANELHWRAGVRALRGAACGRRCGRPQRCELVTGGGVPGGRAPGRLRLEPGEHTEGAVEARLEDPQLRPQRNPPSAGPGKPLRPLRRGRRRF